MQYYKDIDDKPWAYEDDAPVKEGLIKIDEIEFNDIVTRINTPTPEQKLLNCTAEAKSRIAKTDWSVLSDVRLVNVAEYVEYRAILRYLILNPVADPLWPVEPQPVWEAK